MSSIEASIRRDMSLISIKTARLRPLLTYLAGRTSYTNRPLMLFQRKVYCRYGASSILKNLIDKLAICARYKRSRALWCLC